MIAFLERFLPESSGGDEPASTTSAPDLHHPNQSPAELASVLRDFDLLHLAVDPSPAFCRDFGGVYYSRPAAVLRPTSSSDVSRAVRLSLASPSLTLAPRGNGHCVAGQALNGPSGLVLDMSGLSGIDLDPSGDSAWVGAGVLWEDLLRHSLRARQVAPRSWTDYLRLTVGGTLSNGGLSGQAFRHGPQTSNVAELEVVTGHGDVVRCSESSNPDLFFATLGGLGQFGVITAARVPLFPAPDMVRWVRLVYSRFEDYTADAESLVSLPGQGTESFDYVEGFAFVNSDDPVNGWDSVPLRPDQRFDPGLIPPGSGPVLYCLEVVLHLPGGGDDKRMEELMRDLRHVRGLEFVAEVPYLEFLTRVNRAEEVARAGGTWDAPHAWLNLLVSSSDIADFDRNVFRRILRRGIGGPMLVYPLLKSKWDQRMSVPVPEANVFYLVALLRFNSPFPDGPLVEDLIAQNQEIIDCCIANGYDFKIYLPQYKNEEQWSRHFGSQWSRFVERKDRYDPMAILAPGQRIFTRRAN